MAQTPAFDLDAAHRYFAADCFNKAWDLMDKPARSADEDRLMVALNQASIFHWLSRPDRTAQHLSVGYWQASRIQALLGNAAEARRHAETSLTYTPGLDPFYIAYAHEALARAEHLDANPAKAKEHLTNARHHAAQVNNDEHRSMLLKDLVSLDPQ